MADGTDTHSGDESHPKIANQSSTEYHAPDFGIYPYKPLDLTCETRILTLFPGNEYDDELVGSLTPMALASDKPYDALSYCWNASVPWKPRTDEFVNIIAEPGEAPQQHRVADLGDNPGTRYIYVLHGGSMPPGSLVLDGVRVPISGELVRALRRLRPMSPDDDNDDDDDDDEDGPPPQPSQPLRIWVDALCINQGDLSERNEHVKHMFAIYAGATTVHVWLGDEIGAEPDAFAALRTLQHVFTELRDDIAQLSPREVQVRLLAHKDWYGIPWVALGQMLSRAWFSRIWVVQEIANAREAFVYAGRFRIPWMALEWLISRLCLFNLNEQVQNTFATESINSMGQLRRLRAAGDAKDILRLLELLRQHQCTVASDKVYGLLGLMEPADADAVVVDYARSAEDVFTDLAVRHLESGDLRVLCHSVVSSRALKTLALPSWVPDWTRAGWTTPFYVRGLPCQAAGDTEPQVVVDREAGTLRVKGRLLDTISAVDRLTEIPLFEFDPFSWYSYTRDKDTVAQTKDMFLRKQRSIYRALDEMAKMAIPSPEAYSAAKYEALWRTFMCNRTRDGKLVYDDYSRGWELYMSFLRWRASERSLESLYGRDDASTEEVDEEGRSTEAEGKDCDSANNHVDPAIQDEESLEDSQPRKETDEDGSEEEDKEAEPWNGPLWYEQFATSRELERLFRTLPGPWQEMNDLLEALISSEPEPEPDVMVETVGGAHSKWCYDRRFIVSEAGRYGWVVDGAMAGDRVAIFYGCDYPFLLRDEGGNRWSIVGDCYLHGLMDGEALEEQFPEEEIVLV